MSKTRKVADNIDQQTVDSFADEWSRYDQSEVSEAELRQIFENYFHVFPWDRLPENARGFDMGCGSGRWAKFTAERVGHLALIDVSDKTLEVARENLADIRNVDFLQGTANNVALDKCSQDFGYSLGVLHHIPDTSLALASCVELLKPGAPFLVYLYYRFDNRPKWFVAVWRISEVARAIVSKMPARFKHLLTDSIALLIYWPLARFAWLSDTLGCKSTNLPLYGYRNYSLYTMRTDSRDRFGTPFEQRFTREELCAMMQAAGLTDIIVSDREPYWCAVGFKNA